MCYFSPEQVAEVNALMEKRWKHRIEQGADIREIEPKLSPKLSPDREMSDAYLIDDIDEPS